MANPTDPAESPRFQLRVCDGPSCGVTHESERLVACAQALIDADASLRARVGVSNYTCFGRCDEGPNVFVEALAPGEEPEEEPEPEVLESQRGFYPGVDEDKLRRVLLEHCGRGEPVEDLVDDY